MYNKDDLMRYLHEVSKKEIQKLNNGGSISYCVSKGIKKSIDYIERENTTDTNINYLKERLTDIFITPHDEVNNILILSEKSGVREVCKWLTIYDLECRKVNKKSSEYIEIMRKIQNL